MNTKPCIRCGHPHIPVDSRVCDDCWVEMGQMPLFDDDWEPPIDTVFDREEEARGYQVRDPDKYRTIEVNRDLSRVYKGNSLVGQVRRGLDHLWYAEVGDGVRGRINAIQIVVLANEALEEADRVFNG